MILSTRAPLLLCMLGLACADPGAEPADPPPDASAPAPDGGANGPRAGFTVVWAKPDRAGRTLALLEAPGPPTHRATRRLVSFSATGAERWGLTSASLELMDAVPLGDGGALVAAANEAYQIGTVSPDGTLTQFWVVDLTVGRPAVEPCANSDTARLVRTGSAEAALVARVSGGSIVAYRLALDGLAQPQVLGSIVVEPENQTLTFAITGASYDAFGQIAAQCELQIAAAPDGGVFIAAPYYFFPGLPFDARAAYRRRFGLDLMASQDLDRISVTGEYFPVQHALTRLGPDGRRRYVTSLGGPGVEEVRALRVANGTLYVAGRERRGLTNDAWDAYVTEVDPETGVARRTTRLEAAESSIAFDLDVQRDRYVLAGAIGYAQNPNPNGLSVAGGRGLLATGALDPTTGALLGVPALAVDPAGPHRVEVRAAGTFPDGWGRYEVRSTAPDTHDDPPTGAFAITPTPGAP